MISEGPTSHSISTNSAIAPQISDEAEMWRALVTGLRDYVGKKGFSLKFLDYLAELTLH